MWSANHWEESIKEGNVSPIMIMLFSARYNHQKLAQFPTKFCQLDCGGGGAQN